MQRVNLLLKPGPPKDYSLDYLLELRRNLPPPTEKLTSPIMDIMDPIWDFVYDQTEEMTEK
jgi:hypothetical protein